MRAATALLACNGHMSIERAADLMGVLLDAPVATGFTGGLVAWVAACLAGFETDPPPRSRVWLEAFDARGRILVSTPSADIGTEARHGCPGGRAHGYADNRAASARQVASAGSLLYLRHR